MYAKRHYSFWMTIRWSKNLLIGSFLYSFAIVLMSELTDFPFTLPWQPISVIGVAVSFYLGFKNNSSYDRTWEARKIWGNILNDSRTFTTALYSMVNPEVSQEWKKKVIYRHLAWVLALKHTMRKGKPWEHNGAIEKLVFTPHFREECQRGMIPEIEKYLDKEELEAAQKSHNIPRQLMKNQCFALGELFQKGGISEYKHVWLHQLLGKFFDQQGMTERIKNFPFPRQYASTGLWINYIFCSLIPFGLLDIFEISKNIHVWLTVPFSAIIIWIFFLVDRIGDFSENPFEAAYNDVPISAISRTIEIDLLEIMGEKDIPDPYPVENGFLM